MQLTVYRHTAKLSYTRVSDSHMLSQMSLKFGLVYGYGSIGKR